jgi:7-cyano-7-deazaguanine synthase
MKEVVLLSGGVDSAVILAELVAAGKKPWCVSFEYQQPAQNEVGAAEKLAEFYGVTWCASSFNVLSSGNWGFHEWSKMDQPHQVVLKNRNAMFLALASAYGETLYLGAIKNDQEVFEDCRRPFFDEMERVLGVTIKTPLIDMIKAQVLEKAKDLGVPLDLCVSCYRGNVCGVCLSCMERRAAE